MRAAKRRFRDPPRESAASALAAALRGPQLTLAQAVFVCHATLNSPLSGFAFTRFGTFGSYWWWYARAEGAVR